MIKYTSRGDLSAIKRLQFSGINLEGGDYDNRTYVYRNSITQEQRPLTESQYNDTSYTLNER